MAGQRVAKIDERRARLARYTTWSKEDAEDFDRALKEQRTIDEKLWK